jgi:hypothetical protein
MLKERLSTGWGDMDWFNLTRDGDHWRALVNTVMDLWVPENAEEFLGR